MDKSKMMMVIIIALLVLLLGTVVGVGAYLMSMTSPEGGWNEPVEAPPAGVIAIADMRIVSLGDNMIANLYQISGSRQDTVSVDIIVGLDERTHISSDELEAFYDTFNRRIAVARSVANEIFVTKTFDELSTLEGRREAAEDIKNQLQEVFQSNLIVHVSFPNMVVIRG
jgi:flagellar basal body-associated protein FliL